MEVEPKPKDVLLDDEYDPLMLDEDLPTDETFHEFNLPVEEL